MLLVLKVWTAEIDLASVAANEMEVVWRILAETEIAECAKNSIHKLMKHDRKLLRKTPRCVVGLGDDVRRFQFGENEVADRREEK